MTLSPDEKTVPQDSLVRASLALRSLDLEHCDSRGNGPWRSLRFLRGEPVDVWDAALSLNLGEIGAASHLELGSSDSPVLGPLGLR